MEAQTKFFTLEDTLAELQSSNPTFEEVCTQLFKFTYEDFDRLFMISGKEIPNETFLRLPILEGKYVATLKIWGIDYATAIHDHKNYDGHIKVLKGTLTELSYRENENFVELNSVREGGENAIFDEEESGIHSMVNNWDDISVSLHIYRTYQLNLEGIRVFDTAKRRLAYLSNKANSCSWQLSKDSYQRIIKI